MSWSKRRKKFNKTFDVKKHHNILIQIATTKLKKLVGAHIAAKLEYYMLYGYPPFEGAPEYVTPPIDKEEAKRLLNLIYGKRS